MDINENGEIAALGIDLIADTGAYPDGVVYIVLSNGRSRPLNIYRIPNYDFEGFSVYTNNPIAGEFRGIGSIQFGYALDFHIDALVRKADIDPIKLRRRNFIEEGYERLHNGVEECIERGLDQFKELREVPTNDSGPRAWLSRRCRCTRDRVRVRTTPTVTSSM